MSGRTWKNQDLKTLEKLKNQLLTIGGEKTEIKNSHELWRIKIADSVFISFKTGTLYHTPSNSSSNDVLSACQQIDAITGTGYIPPSKDYLIGLDETGKGEIAGPIVLAGVIFHKGLFEDFVKLVGSADTKKLHSPQYWQEIYNELDRFRGEDFKLVAEKIPPSLVDQYNVNHLLDLFYQRIISTLLKWLSDRSCRIVLDDYGAGKDLRKFETGDRNEVLILPKAEDQYIEAKVASLISKKIREGILENINQLPEFWADDVSIGNGNISNPQTARWLSKWHSGDKPWPWFIKQSFKTISDLEGSPKDQRNKVKKISPTLRKELLPSDFLKSFHKNNSPINLSAIKCSNCGQFQQTILFDLEQIICQNCSKIMDDLRLTLRYYCGSLITAPDILEQNILIKDLEYRAFFENYRVIVPWTNSMKQNPQFAKGGKALKKMEAFGRLDLEYCKLDKVLNAQVIQKAVPSNSILITSSPHRQSQDVKVSHDNSLVNLARDKKVLVCLVQ